MYRVTFTQNEVPAASFDSLPAAIRYVRIACPSCYGEHDAINECWKFWKHQTDSLIDQHDDAGLPIAEIEIIA